MPVRVRVRVRVRVSLPVRIVSGPLYRGLPAVPTKRDSGSLAVVSPLSFLIGPDVKLLAGRLPWSLRSPFSADPMESIPIVFFPLVRLSGPDGSVSPPNSQSPPGGFSLGGEEGQAP